MFSETQKNNISLVKYDENEPFHIREYTGEAISEMMRIGREKGFFVTYNHPTWSLESYPQYMSYNGMHAMEMYNGGANAAGFLDYNPRVYDEDRIICTYGIRRPHMVLDEDGYTVTCANFRMEKDFKYFRITVVAKDGKTACTNAYFADDLFEE